GQPALHLLVVALARLAPGLLAGPAEPPLEDLADVLGVVGPAEALADEPRHAGGGPQLVGPAVLPGTLGEEALELLEVVVGQPRRRTGAGAGVEAVRPAGQAPPAMHGGGLDTEDAGDLGRGLAPLDQFNGAATPALQFFGGSFGSHSAILRACSCRVAFAMLDSVAPTAPWWPLRGAWKIPDRRPAKLLVFSRFRAVPQTVAA